MQAKKHDYADPGARGLYSQPPEETPGYRQPITNITGKTELVEPFRIGPKQYAWDLDDPNHAYDVYVQKLNIDAIGQAHMDRFAAAEQESVTAPYTALQAYQMGLLAMAHVDCDTVPISWQYATRFTLFDNFFTRHIGPSAPGAIAMLSAQIGETQWVTHPEQAFTPNSRGVGLPVVADNDPVWGPWQGSGSALKQYNLTFATWPLLLTGNRVSQLVTQNIEGIEPDIDYIQRKSTRSIPWGWYQNGYNNDPADPNYQKDLDSYIAHHNAPQYFGYIANNPALRNKLYNLEKFFPRIEKGQLPRAGGVFVARGGYANIAGLVPVNPSDAAKKAFVGDEMHAGYSDAQISDALVARTVNAIARSRYWHQSVILIAFDEGGGWYDHVPVRALTTGPTNEPITLGGRTPLTVISPYANAHSISHEESNQASVAKFIEDLFNLPRLGRLPIEAQAMKQGQQYLGPWDAGVPGVGNLLSAFSIERLAGAVAPLPASYAVIPERVVNMLPQYNGMGCKALEVVPENVAKGIPNNIPPLFNPLPETNPTPP